jgi:hypothetical protein
MLSFPLHLAFLSMPCVLSCSHLTLLRLPLALVSSFLHDQFPFLFTIAPKLFH